MEFNFKLFGQISCYREEKREEDDKWFDVVETFDFGHLTEKECQKFYKYDWENGKAFKDVFNGRFKGSGFSGGQRSDLHFHIRKVEGTDKVHVTMRHSYLEWKEGCSNSILI